MKEKINTDPANDKPQTAEIFGKVDHICKNIFVKNNSINKVDKNNRKIIKTIYLGNTQIKKIIYDKRYLYIYSDYYEFDKEKYLSNLVCLNKKLEIKWYGELPFEDDYFSNIEEHDDKNIIGITWNGFTCILDKNNGRIKEKLFTK